MLTKELVNGMLAHAGAGIEVDGPNPWDPQVTDPRFYQEIESGSIGLGMAFVKGFVTVQDRPELFRRLLASKIPRVIERIPEFTVSYDRASEDGNVQSKELSKRIGPGHYDYTPIIDAMIGPSQVYTCAYYDRGAETLEDAQAAKQGLICQKLKLGPGHRVLDIGCGYAPLLAEMVRVWGIVQGVGISLSDEQLSIARQRYRGMPLELRKQDYRDLPDAPGSFDRIVSVGMWEHVGVPNYPEAFDICHRLLADDGLMLIHLVTDTNPTTPHDTFMELIFPGADLPTPAEVIGAAEHAGFVHEDSHNLSVNYARTLAAWAKNLRRQRAQVAAKVGNELVEMYLHYLELCQGSFEARASNVHQFVFSKGKRGGYVSVR